MREIKFRAWNKDQEIMCYDDEDRTKEYMDGILSTRIGLINSWLSTPEYEFDYRSLYEVMQYTGLKDKNGKEIYEGDLITLTDPYINQEAIGVAKIVFSYDYVGGWVAEANYRHLNIGTRTHMISVVGNIYENPELLEGVTSKEEMT
ncbi:YopX family protein [Virgibacillus sp. Bac332]|uniref:YopX family protein n=1 Tax=Virgibacillus sp. Bac332 TaxID=2419842 RepID=UPI0013CE7D42|nr:YopX family protein [Virgibacillus sp. Bac332]